MSVRLPAGREHLHECIFAWLSAGQSVLAWLSAGEKYCHECVSAGLSAGQTVCTPWWQHVGHPPLNALVVCTLRKAFCVHSSLMSSVSLSQMYEPHTASLLLSPAQSLVARILQGLESGLPPLPMLYLHQLYDIHVTESPLARAYG
jgi:hypothetical protein